MWRMSRLLRQDILETSSNETLWVEFRNKKGLFIMMELYERLPNSHKFNLFSSSSSDGGKFVWCIQMSFLKQYVDGSTREEDNLEKMASFFRFSRYLWIKLVLGYV